MNVKSFLEWKTKNAVIVQSLQTYPTRKRLNIRYIQKYDNGTIYDVIRA